MELIVDRSASMRSMGDTVVKGLNQFLLDQHDKAQPEEIVTATLTTFDNGVHTVWSGKVVASPDGAAPPTVRQCDVEPRGQTALLDAIGETLDRAELEAAGHADVIVVILTDGSENASRKHTKPQVVTTVERLKREHGWEFVFLAANQDAATVGRSFGIDAATSLYFTATSEGQEQCFSSLTGMVNRARDDYRRCGQAAAPAQMFTSQERQQCQL